MAAEIRIKVYFEDEYSEGVHGEVRMLALPEEPSFSGLEGHLLTLLSDSQQLYSPSQPLKIQYVDGEGDRVTIGCGEELRIFLAEHGPSPHKLFVQTALTSRAPTRLSNTSVAESLCTCCHKVIRGFQYKCVLCPQYTICMRCERLIFVECQDKRQVKKLILFGVPLGANQNAFTPGMT